MPFICYRLTVLSSFLLLIAGCGGGGSGSSSGGGGGQSNTPTTVTFTFQGATPTAVAASIGAGAYTAEALNGSTLTLSIPSGTTKFAVAYACPVQVFTVGGVQESQFAEETVFEATTTDGTSFNQSCTSSSSGAQEGTFSGSVDANAIPDASSSYLDIQAANSGAFWDERYTVDSPATNFSFSIPTGSYRMMAGVMSYSNITQQYTLTAARDFGSQTIPGTLNSGNTVVLGAADETTSQTIAYNNVPSGFSSPLTAVSFVFGDVGDLSIASGATNQYPVLPAAATESGDYYFLTASALSSGYPLQGVEAFLTSSTAGPVAFNLPAPWSYTGPAAAALPTFDMSYSGFAGQTGVYDSVQLEWGAGTSNTNFINIIATASYQNGSSMLALPDLSGLNGFLVAPPSGTDVVWTAEVAQSSAKMGQLAAPNTSGSVVLVQGGYLEP
ncbi:MAG: hypothetical protein WBD67_00890 [Terracidiphilus sp.]